MSEIHWIFGATAVGKKRFINHVVDNPSAFGFPEGILPVWYECGDIDTNETLRCFMQSPIIIRWQWKRESVLEKIAINNPDVTQKIHVCKVMPSVQLARVRQREGADNKWDEWALIREMLEVERLVHRLSMQFRIPVQYVDVTEPDYK